MYNITAIFSLRSTGEQWYHLQSLNSHNLENIKKIKTYMTFNAFRKKQTATYFKRKVRLLS